ncbi:MAG TPA: ATP-binding protein [Longimicrobiales bacterium]|nr:ATP-binding protein [Longimicrobiales bacterium]
MPEDVVGRLNQLSAAAAVLASDGRVLAWNRDAAALLGWKHGAQPRLAGANAPWLLRLLGAVEVEGSGLVVISRQRRDGTRRVLRLRASRFADRDLLVLIRDCTNEVGRPRHASVKEHRLRQFLDQLSDVVRDHAMLVADERGQIASWNSGAERLTGIAAEHVMGRHLAVLLVQEPAQIVALLERAAGTGRAEMKMDVRRSNGATMPAHVTIARLNDMGQQPTSFAIVLRDLSEQMRAEENLRRSEEQLRHSQKMDAVGRLASGIAHDFNNVLTAIQGHVQFLLEDLPQDLASRDDAEEIRKAADRATELTRQLLTFARKQPSKPISLSPNTLITEIEKLLRRLIRADVTLDTVLEDVPNVLIDPGQLEQVIVNLVVNARDAIGGTGGITITTSRVSVDQIGSARGLDLTPGDYVKIAVSDTGEGMSQATQLQIFEPFFTTKAEGTGLGLSTVYGIVKQAGGHISVYSESGRGTTFRVYLPVQEAGDATTTVISEGMSQSGTGTVLLVEDDASVRALAKRTLEASGYEVVEAADGEEALRIADGKAGIDVVVTDLTMPHLGGDELATRIRETNPDAGIVLMSGFSEVSLVREGRIGEHDHFLEKPFTPNALVDVVREAMQNIDGPSPTEPL